MSNNIDETGYEPWDETGWETGWEPGDETGAELMIVDWLADIQIEGGGDATTLTFGFSPDATDGFDDSIDIAGDPADPEPSFHAAFNWDSTRYQKLVLNGDPDDLIEHVIEIKLQFDEDEFIQLEWDNTRWPDYMSSAKLIDSPQGNEIDVDMLTETSVDIADSGTNLLLLKIVPKADFAMEDPGEDPDETGAEPDPNLQAPDFVATVAVDAGGDPQDLEFGFSPDATDEADPAFDIEAGDPPQFPEFDAAIVWEGDRFEKVVLNGDLNDLVLHLFRIELQFDEGDEINLTWDNTDWSELMESARLVDEFDGDFIDVDMLVESDVQFMNEDLTSLRLEITPKAVPAPPAYEDPTDLVDVCFKASIRDTDDNFLTSGAFFVQFYSTAKNSWQNLIGAEVGDEGKLEAIYTLPPTMNDPTLNTGIGAVLAAGVFPALRLAEKNSTLTDSPEVFAFGGSISLDEENFRLTLDFGEMWMLENSVAMTKEGQAGEVLNSESKSVQGSAEAEKGVETPAKGGVGDPQAEASAMDYKKGAVARPMETEVLYPALLAAVNQPENFEGFDPAEDMVSIRPIGSPSIETDIIVLTSQIDLLQAQLDSMVIELQSKESLIESQDTLRVALQEEKDILQAQVDTIQRTPRAVTDVYTEIVNDVEAAKNQLSDSDFEVSNIKINLKTHVVSDDDGIKLQPVDAATAVNTTEASVSDVEFQIGIKDISNPTTAGVTPKVLGLTETATRQRLNSLGYKLKAIYQASQGQVIGQAFKQVPEAGEDIVPNDVVTVIFAKNEGDFN